VPAAAAAGEVPADSDSEADPVPPAPVRPATGFDEFSTRIAQSLTECWSGAFMGLEGQFCLDRDRLQAALANLDKLAGNVQSVAGCLDPLSERTEILDRNYHELGPRLFDAEQRLATSQRGIELLNEELGEIRELCQGVQAGLRIQAETTAALEKTVWNQAELIGTQLKSALSEFGGRFEALTQTLGVHTEAIGKLDASYSRADAAAQSLEHRLDRQAQAIQSVHGVAQAQADRWAQLREVTVGFANLLQSPVGNPPAAPEL
jgi:chromosome segregation ATPase